MFHHHEIFFSRFSGYRKRGENRVEERQKSWKICKAKEELENVQNKVVNQYECPVVIERQRRSQNIHNCTKIRWSLLFFAFTFLTHGTAHTGWPFITFSQLAPCDVHREFVHFTDLPSLSSPPWAPVFGRWNTKRHSFIIAGKRTTTKKKVCWGERDK